MSDQTTTVQLGQFTPEQLALARLWYPDAADDAESIAEDINSFAVDQGRLPRCADEMDAYSNSVNEWEAYLEANPLPIAEPAAAASPALSADQIKAQAEKEALSLQEFVERSAAALVKCLKAGESSLTRSYVEAGRHAHNVIVGKMKQGHKRDSAVQFIGGQLALHSSGAVDVNRLIRTWAAWELLCVKQGLQKEYRGDKDRSIPYGTLSQAYAMLVDCVDQGKVTEHYALRRGVDDLALKCFAAGVKAGWVRKDAIEHCQVVVNAHLKFIANEKALQEAEKKRLKDAADAEEKKKREETAAATRLAQKAKDDAEQAAADLLAAEEEAKKNTPEALAEAARLKTEADEKAAVALKAQTDAAQASLDHESARLNADVATKQAATAASEAKTADGKLIDAQAKVDTAAKKREEKSAPGTPAAAAASVKQPSVESNPGKSLIAGCKTACTKDVGSMAADCIRANEDPAGSLYDMLLNLFAQAPANMQPVDIVRTLYSAIEGAKLGGLIADSAKAAKAIVNSKVEGKLAPAPSTVLVSTPAGGIIPVPTAPVTGEKPATVKQPTANVGTAAAKAIVAAANVA